MLTCRVACLLTGLHYWCMNLERLNKAELIERLQQQEETNARQLVPVTTRLPRELVTELKRYARTHDISIQDVTTDALRAHLGKKRN